MIQSIFHRLSRVSNPLKRVATALAGVALFMGTLAGGHVAADDAVPDVPYRLPVSFESLPDAVSPDVDPVAPYTPTVMGLLEQLLPGDEPTYEQLQNAARLITGGSSEWCRNVGGNDMPYGLNDDGKPAHSTLAGATTRAVYAGTELAHGNTTVAGGSTSLAAGSGNMTAAEAGATKITLTGGMGFPGGPPGGGAPPQGGMPPQGGGPPGGGMPGGMTAGTPGFVVGQTVQIGTGDGMETAVIAGVETGGQGGTGITLASPLAKKHAIMTQVTGITPAGTATIRVENGTDFLPGQTIRIDTGSTVETRLVKGVSTGTSSGTEIALDAPLDFDHSGPVPVIVLSPAGSKTLKVADVGEFAVGDMVTIDTGKDLETAVVAGIGTGGAAGTGLTFKNPLDRAHACGSAVRMVSAAAGAKTIRVRDIAPFAPGDTITVGTGDTLETAQIAKVGTSGRTGTGIELAAPLTRDHFAGEAVTKPLVPGVSTLFVSEQKDFNSGDTVMIGAEENSETAVIEAIGPGASGFTLAAPLTRAHENGSVVKTVFLPGDRKVKVQSVDTFKAGQSLWIDYPSGSGGAEKVTVRAVGTAGAGGTGVELVSGLTRMHATGAVIALLTTPTISPLCWADAQGINVNSGPNQDLTTAPMQLLGLAATFDRHYANLWGQVEGREGRQLMVTGLLGPQADLDIFTNWQRAVNSSSGEDPYLGYEMAAAQVNGMQGVGLMSQVKHFGPYDGTNENKNSVLTDQALHEMRMVPFEGAFVGGGAAAGMSSYHLFQNISPYLEKTVDAVIGSSPYLGKEETSPRTWVLNEAHWSSENPWLLNYLLRDVWGSQAAIGPDYGGEHSSSQILQGMDFSPNKDYYTGSPRTTVNDTSSTCADDGGNEVSCGAPGARRITGIPGPGCSKDGCNVVDAVMNGTLSMAVFKQSLARMLYQQERFGLLGCVDGGCENPGGIGDERTGTALLPAGGATAVPEIGTKSGDAAIVEKGAEMGGVLLKNEENILPIGKDDLDGGIFITGANAEINIAAPTNEAAKGFADRNAIGPLLQLKSLSENPGAFTYMPALDPTGKPVPGWVLSPLPSSGPAPTSAPLSDGKGGLQRSFGPGLDQLAADSIDSCIDHTTVSGQGQLAGDTAYVWDGWLYVPEIDVYTFRFQHSASIPEESLTFSLDGENRALSAAGSFYNGYYYGMTMVPVSPTVAGYTEAGLTNREFEVPAGTPLAVGWHRVRITIQNTGNDPKASFRFAYSREAGDIAEAAAAARGKRMAIVFAHDAGREEVNQNQATSSTLPVPHLADSQERLIRAVAAANPNTVVVLNDGMPVIVNNWIGEVKGVLEMWNPGQEGGTATARLLLGQANPGGRLPVTWPLNETDAIHLYDEPADGLYPGSTAGTHPERLNGAEDGTSIQSQGIYTGYRYFDKLDIPVRYPFGYGLSYTDFEYSKLKLSSWDGGVQVRFTVTNTGDVQGTAVPQVYVGPAKKVPGYVQQAVRSLRGFERVALGPGESRQVSIFLDARSFQYWDEPSQKWVTGTGKRTVWVGKSSRDLPLSGKVRIR